MSLNKVMLIGRLGRDPEVRMTQGGAKACTLSLATSETWVKDGQKQEKTEWHRVVIWGKLSDVAEKYLSKGKEVYIEGKMVTRSWDGPDGQKRYATEVVASDMRFIGNKDNSHQSSSTQSSQSNNPYGHVAGSQESYGQFGEDDDVPF